MKTCLITGATGLIGSRIASLLGDDWHPIGVMRSKGEDEMRSPDYEPLELDLSTDWTNRALPDRVDAIVHMAQSEHYRELPSRALEVFDVNVRSTLKLQAYAAHAGASHFVHASSGAVYDSPGPAMRETDPVSATNRNGLYAASKICAELIASNDGRFHAIALRFFFVYGPRQRDSALVPRLIASISQGAPLALAGHDGLHLNPCYVDDAAMATVAALGLQSSSAINVAGPQTLSLREVAYAIGRQVGREPRFEINQSVPSPYFVADTQTMREKLVAPRWTFEDGISEVLNAPST